MAVASTRIAALLHLVPDALHSTSLDNTSQNHSYSIMHHKKYTCHHARRSAKRPTRGGSQSSLQWTELEMRPVLCVRSHARRESLRKTLLALYKPAAVNPEASEYCANVTLPAQPRKLMRVAVATACSVQGHKPYDKLLTTSTNRKHAR